MDSTWLSALGGFVHLRTEETGPPTHGTARKSVRRSRYVGGRYHDHRFDMQLSSGGMNWELIVAGLVVGSIIGAIMAVRVEMTGMPELVALFNGFGGAASALVALSETWKYIENPDHANAAHRLNPAGGRCRSGPLGLGWLDDPHRVILPCSSSRAVLNCLVSGSAHRRGVLRGLTPSRFC